MKIILVKTIFGILIAWIILLYNNHNIYIYIYMVFLKLCVVVVVVVVNI